MKNKIYYFDNAATSFPKPDEVAVSVFDTIKNYSANPGRSSHKLAIESGRVVFNTRENIAELMCYEDSENHKKAHKALLNRFEKLKADWAAGNVDNGQEVLDFLVNWLQKHILETDVDYLPAVMAHKNQMAKAS